MIKNIRILGSLLLVFVSSIGISLATETAPHRNVLIVHSYSQEYPWTKRQHQGFVETLVQKTGGSCNLSVEYLDTKRHPYHQDYANETADYLRKKYRNYTPDAIYVTDDNAMSFALSHLQSLFDATPIFFSGVNNYRIYEQLTHRMTGSFEKQDFATNLVLLEKLGLSSKRLILIGDNSETFRAMIAESVATAPREIQNKISIVSDDTFVSSYEQLKLELKRYPDAVLMLISIGTWRDLQGLSVPVKESIRALTTLNVPIVSMEDTYLYDGVVGGFVTSGKNQGKNAASMLLAHLQGQSMTQLSPVMDSPNELILNEKSLKKYHIVIDRELYQQATIIDPLPSFYDINKSLILSLVYVLIALLTLGTVFAILLMMKKNKQLLYARTQADNANRAKSEFLGSMSHELRTPLNAILGFSQLILTVHTSEAERNDFIKEIQKAGHHLLELVNDLIDLSRIEAGKLTLTLEPVLLSDLANDVITLVEPLAEKFEITIERRSLFQEAVYVDVDKLRLKQVVINLLSNAIKYNRKQGKVTMECEEPVEGRVRISIVDTGFGISKEKRAKLFQSFERLGAEKSKTEGAGIGLVITKRLVESMGGVIGVESVEDQGSVFWVEFPRYQVSELTSPSPLPVLVSKTKPDGQEIVSPSSEKNIQQPSVKSKRTPLVLCIEDNPLNLKLLTILLQKNGAFVLLEAVNGEMGVHIAKSVIPDLILSDIHLPDIDGYQIIAQLREDENTKDIPVIALTGDVMKEDIQQAEAAGFAGYVTKPVDIAVLLAMIDKVLKENNL